MENRFRTSDIVDLSPWTYKIDVLTLLHEEDLGTSALLMVNKL